MHQEVEGVAALAAAEALEGAALCVDGEGGRLLLVEGAQALVVAACLLEADVAADQVHQVDAIADQLNGLVGDPAQPRVPPGPVSCLPYQPDSSNQSDSSNRRTLANAPSASAS